MNRGRFLQYMAGSSLTGGLFSHLRYPDGSPSRRELIDLWRISGELTVEFAEAMPVENYLFRPSGVDDIYTYGRQMQHIAENNVNLMQAYITDEPAPDISLAEESDKTAILQNIRRSFDYGVQAIRSTGLSEMVETVEFFAAPLPRWHVLFIAQDHTTHHLGQSVIYLRACGVSPPRWRKWPQI